MTRSPLFFVLAFFGKTALADPNSFSIYSMGIKWDFVLSKPLVGKLNVSDWETQFRGQLQNYDEIFSDWNSQSQMRNFESLDWKNWHTVGPEIKEVFNLVQIFYTQTRGLFDPTVGGFNFKDSPAKEGDWKDIDFSKWEQNKIRFKKNPGRLSFGGILKGFLIADFAHQLIKKEIFFFEIDSGGGNRCQGEKNSVFFESNSKVQDRLGNQHIWNPQNPQVSTGNQSRRIRCALDFKSLPADKMRRELVHLGAASDVFSTVILTQPNIPLPKNCRAY